MRASSPKNSEEKGLYVGANTAALSAIMFLLLISVIYIILPKSIQVQNSSSVETTMVQTVNASIANSFIRTFNPPSLPAATQNPEKEIFIYFECNASNFDNIELFEPFSQYPFSVTANISVNYSTINQSQPLVLEYKVGVVDPDSLGSYESSVANNGGYCKHSLDLLRYNSTFSSQRVNFSDNNGINSSGYLMRFSNFSEAGLSLIRIYYFGQRPDLDLYLTSVFHKNMDIMVMSLGFSGHTNASQIINYTNYTLRAFESQYG